MILWKRHGQKEQEEIMLEGLNRKVIRKPGYKLAIGVGTKTPETFQWYII